MTYPNGLSPFTYEQVSSDEHFITPGSIVVDNSAN